ncbi:ABC-three component system middle component 6 [Anabaena sp. UHCC 0399]|uniref:ABC-three component system middle component 6 n=1 Tax=Anabaena sp. UHCC 0399 TaxID=3110238 RepID=UPI002B2160DC|nr:ABC-three component system middle component 6 [Anabaena sp. UHCC 0399]MEA5566774.1 ABC-three component system middle component 6 [Anabaena sp. UHCC 0399]
MILPTKHISTSHSLLGVGATILEHLYQPKTVSSLWSAVATIPEVGTFERFVLTLDLLYTIGAIEMEMGLLRRCHQ